uniref:Tetratricopeptide repeat protein 39B n=1 Tax=Sphaerodactylus townsendi TaxID=933632 RepID=A0ACB8ERG4_9SAUR
MALNLFLNNKFSEALELLRPWSKGSMYHALGYSTILVMQAAMTFEQQDIQMGIATMKEALQTCQKFRKRNTVVESLSSLVSKQTVDQMSEASWVQKVMTVLPAPVALPALQGLS